MSAAPPLLAGAAHDSEIDDDPLVCDAANDVGPCGGPTIAAEAETPASSRARWVTVGATALAGAALTAWFVAPHLHHAAPSLFPAYEPVRAALADDSFAEAKKQAAALATVAKEAKRDDIAATAGAIANASSIADARAAFSTLSDAMIAYRKQAKAGTPAVAYCSMEKKYWLQSKGEISNPYLGKSMPTCGEFKENL